MPKLIVFAILLAALLIFPETINADGQIYINEFASDVETGEREWVEFYNSSNVDQQLTGWVIEERTGSDLSGTSSHALDLVTVPGGGFAIFELSSKLNNGGDILTLKNGVAVIDSVSYGSAENSQIDAPQKGQSVGRGQDASSSWVIFTSVTKGSTNSTGVINVEPSPSATPQGSTDTASGTKTKTSATNTKPMPSPSPAVGGAKASNQTTGKIQGSSAVSDVGGENLNISQNLKFEASPLSTPSAEAKEGENSPKIKIAAIVTGAGSILIGLSVAIWLWYKKVRLAKNNTN